MATPTPCANDLVGRLPGYISKRDVEAKLSHLADLQARLQKAGLTVRDLAEAEPADNALRSQAYRKVLDQPLEWRAMTPAMHDTPRSRLERRARRGYWPQFPSDPEVWAAQLAGHIPRSGATKGKLFRLSRHFESTLHRLDCACTTESDRLALYRAFHTVALELADNCDDSYGVIGDVRIEAFSTYVGMDWAATGLAPSVYWQDLCELLVHEPYGLTHRDETLPFSRVPPEQVKLVETTLLALSNEWRAAYDEYNEEQALVCIAWLHLGCCEYARYADAARLLGSQRWRTVVALAESAVAAGRLDVAVAVFDAADQPGAHREFLQSKRDELLRA